MPPQDGFRNLIGERIAIRGEAGFSGFDIGLELGFGQLDGGVGALAGFGDCGGFAFLKLFVELLLGLVQRCRLWRPRTCFS